MNLARPVSGGSDYLKLESGENRIRIIGEIISGFETWVHDEMGHHVHRQDYRWKALELDEMGVEDRKQKQFYAFFVWNYNTEKIECAVQTQTSIKEGIYSLVTSDDWGNDGDYDILINRTGSGMETSYTVMPKPKKEFEGDADISNYNIKALFTNGNPFENE